MAYQKPGFFVIPDGKILIDLAREVASVDSFEASVSGAIRSLSKSGNTLMSRIGREQILAMKGEGPISKGTPALSALQHLLMRMLAHAGIVKEVPLIIGYASYPELTFDDVIDRIMSSFIVWPDLADLGGADKLTIEQFSTYVPIALRKMAFLGNLRPSISGHLARKLGDIAFSLARGKPIDQAELSFFLAFFNARKGNPRVGDYATELKAVRASEVLDPVVLKTWELYRGAVEHGPFLRFGMLDSNTSLEQLLFTYGPRPASFSFGIGYGISVGPDWQEFVVPQAPLTVSTAAGDSLMAARERSCSYYRTDAMLGVEGAQPTIRNYRKDLPSSSIWRPHWDLPEVKIELDLKSGEIKPLSYSYHSKWRGRQVDARFGASPESMLVDLALATSKLGGGEHASLNATDFPLVDVQRSAPFLGGRRIHEKYASVHTVFLPDPQGGGMIEVDVPMEQHFRQLGSLLFKPAFTEHFQVCSTHMSVIDEGQRHYVTARLGLTHERILQATRAIDISNRFSYLSSLFGEGAMPFGREQLLVLTAAVSGRSASARKITIDAPNA